MPSPLLSLENLSTHYVSQQGTRVVRAVDEVTLSLNAGETFIPWNFGYRPKMRIIDFDKDGKVKRWSYSK